MWLFKQLLSLRCYTRSRLALRSALTGFVATAFILLIHFSGGFQAMELQVFDWQLGFCQKLPPDPRILVVGITEADIQQQQRWPLSDQTIAQTIQKLLALKPAAVGLDIYRDFPQPPGNQLLQAQLQFPDVFSITNLGAAGSSRVPPPKGIPLAQVGFNDFVQDPDGVIRRNLLYAAEADYTYMSFGLQLALHYLKKKQIYPAPVAAHPDNIRLGLAEISPLTPESGGYQGVNAEGYQMMLNYCPHIPAANTVTLTQVLEDGIKPEQVEDKIILIGTTASSGKDLFITPFSEQHLDGRFFIPGIMLHAHAVSELISIATGDSGIAAHPATTRTFQFWSGGMEYLWIISWSLLGGLLCWRSHHPLKLLLAVSGGILILYVCNLILFQQLIWIPLFAPVAGFVFVSSSVLANRYAYHSFYDNLTGLPNHSFFSQHLRRLNQQRHVASDNSSATNVINTEIAVVLLDLERFKIINAVLGHLAGDSLLKTFARRIQHSLDAQGKTAKKATVCIARMGGTEFGILLKSRTGQQDLSLIAKQLAAGIHQEISRSFQFQQEEVFTHANIGIALGRSGDARDLLRNARAAMNRAKTQETHEPEIFTIDMQEKEIAHFQLERDLRNAFKQPETANALPTPQVHNQTLPSSHSRYHLPEFLLYYQPLVRLETGELSGFEALLRWRHPERGMVSPAQFVPVAEESNLIIPIGEWVLSQACHQMRHWQQQFPHYANLLISVNLSAKQLNHPHLLESIQEILEDSQLPPAQLKLEVTETMIMQDVQKTLALLEQFKSMGIQISIDDFGTGYSSLEYLSCFPANYLKVDQSFIRLMLQSNKHCMIVESIIELAHKLDMQVISEGVEEVQQALRLKNLGSEYGQGYLFSRPLPVGETEALLTEVPSWLYLDRA
ncbi:EAL domain-containing protein [Candidatus Venteria ishoeyi]|uniref:Phytochrome-like protein cph2 n=1 Tax=Candidatus Venteria ishoeyi TaxID=1899563 RepID=A0A1H6F8R5_9GAMM|nr:EAL domain-containing protein [Candidatus Venteria ishoeyi]SEH05699.1 Phytochrome-like protein cph2 [Candidatus Venteria ishoeyi]